MMEEWNWIDLMEGENCLALLLMDKMLSAVFVGFVVLVVLYKYLSEYSPIIYQAHNAMRRCDNGMSFVV